MGEVDLRYEGALRCTVEPEFSGNQRQFLVDEEPRCRLSK
jgi:hypothetical protein